MVLSTLTKGSTISSVECRTLDHKVAGSNLTRAALLWPCARHFIFIAYYWFNPGKRPYKTEKLLSGK